MVKKDIFGRAGSRTYKKIQYVLPVRMAASILSLYFSWLNTPDEYAEIARFNVVQIFFFLFLPVALFFLVQESMWSYVLSVIADTFEVDWPLLQAGMNFLQEMMGFGVTFTRHNGIFTGILNSIIEYVISKAVDQKLGYE